MRELNISMHSQAGAWERGITKLFDAKRIKFFI